MTVSTASAAQPRPLASVLDWGIWILWHVVSAVCIPLALSEVRLKIPVWEMSFQVRAFLASISVAHLVAAVVLSGLLLKRRRAGLPSIIVAVVLTYATLFVVQQVAGIGYSRSVVIMAAAASVVFLALSLEMMPRLFKVLVPALLVATVVMGRVAFAGWPADDGVSPTVFYEIKLVDTRVRVPAVIRGGAIAPLGDRLVIVSADGEFYSMSGDSTAATRLPYETPFNRSEYLGSKPQNLYSIEPFRIAGMLFRQEGERFTAFLSHHYWRANDACITVRVSKADAGRDEFLNGKAALQWQTVFETSPCLKLGELKMEQTGGRMVLLDAQTMLLTVGDHGQDGVSAKAMVSQDMSSHYGKVLKIDLATGKGEVFTSGHRNPQGLALAADGSVWETEQGPGGGDELNFLRAGTDYGWPKVTYGTEYDEVTWPLNAADNRHDGFQMPAFSWVPSIASTAVISLATDRFPVWKGDLLVASLKGQLLRLRADGDRIVFSEPLLMTKMRMRDIVEAPDGRVYIFQDDGSISYVEPVTELPERTKLGPPRAGQAPHPGAALYRSCQVCHRSGAAAESAAGPDLTGVVGRPVAAAPGYAYSSALRSVSGAWTAERLNRFLENPEAFAPGTLMKTEGIQDAEARRQLVDYLATRK